MNNNTLHVFTQLPAHAYIFPQFKWTNSTGDSRMLLLIASVAFVVMIMILNMHLRDFFCHELLACALITSRFECSDIM